MRRSLRVGTALDETGRGELVDQARERDRREVELFGEFRLARAFAALQARQHGPLGASRRHRASALVGEGAKQTRNVIQRESKLARGRGSHET